MNSVRMWMMVVAWALSGCVAEAQDAMSTPRYDAVSIRPHKEDASMMMHFQGSSNGFTEEGVTVLSLLYDAYGIRSGLIAGVPSWAEAQRYDVQAKVLDADPEALKKLTPEQRREMMRKLLEDRFGLKAHVEVKALPVYDLVIARGGLKMTPSPVLAPDDRNAGGWMSGGSGSMKVKRGTIANLATNLSFRVDRNVTDRTGLTGLYDYTLKWTPDQAGPTPAEAGLPDAPPLLQALEEELGLKLVPAKGPVETLVVDHMEAPTEN